MDQTGPKGESGIRSKRNRPCFAVRGGKACLMFASAAAHLVLQVAVLDPQIALPPLRRRELRLQPRHLLPQLEYLSKVAG